MLSPLLRAATLLGPSLLICRSHLSVLLIKQSIIKSLLQCLPLVSPLPKQGSAIKQREQPGSADSFGNMMALVPEREPDPHGSGIMLHFNLLSIKTQKVISPSRRKINSFLFQHQGMHFISSPRGLIKGHDQRQRIGDGFAAATGIWHFTVLSMGHFSGSEFTPAKRLRFDHQSIGSTSTGKATWGTARRTTELSCRQHQQQLWFSPNSTQQHSSPGRTTSLAQT